VRRYVRESSLGLFFLVIFFAALVAQALVGHSDFNDQQIAHNDPTVSLGRFLTSSVFLVDVMENWQSEYLQFTLFILATIWLVQRGSTESKPLGKEGLESDEEQKVGEHAEPDSPKWAKAGGWRLAIYSNSLVTVMVTIWLWSWFAQSVSGWSENNAELLEHEQPSLSWFDYLGSANFWETTLQNWQSEFLAVGSMAVLSIYLRQRGSPESKPVGTPHETTAATG